MQISTQTDVRYVCSQERWCVPARPASGAHVPWGTVTDSEKWSQDSTLGGARSPQAVGREIAMGFRSPVWGNPFPFFEPQFLRLYNKSFHWVFSEAMCCSLVQGKEAIREWGKRLECRNKNCFLFSYLEGEFNSEGSRRPQTKRIQERVGGLVQMLLLARLQLQSPFHLPLPHTHLLTCVRYLLLCKKVS